MSFVLALAVLFLAGLIHATLGFGTGLVAMPLLVLTIGLDSAAPVVALVGLINVLLVLGRTWEHVEFRPVARLLAASAIGIPLGLVLLRAAPAYPVKALLGVVVIGFSGLNLLRPELPRLRADGSAVVFGLVAGVLGGAYNVNGPPLVLYGALRRWPPRRFHANLQSFFLPSSVLICAGHAAAGLWTADVLRLFAASLPLLALATVLGARLGQRIAPERFRRVLYVAMIGLGLLLFL